MSYHGISQLPNVKLCNIKLLAWTLTTKLIMIVIALSSTIVLQKMKAHKMIALVLRLSRSSSPKLDVLRKDNKKIYCWEWSKRIKNC